MSRLAAPAVLLLLLGLALAAARSTLAAAPVVGLLGAAAWCSERRRWVSVGGLKEGAAAATAAVHLGTLRRWPPCAASATGSTLHPPLAWERVIGVRHGLHG